MKDSMFSKISPALVLLFMAPVLGELVSGHQHPLEFMNPLSFVLTAHLSISGDASISAYDSNIYKASPGWFRIILRVGFTDFNGNGVFDTSEAWDYHWWYQTTNNHGAWADKPGWTPSRLQTDSNGIDPSSLVWSGYVEYNSTGKYYQIRDSRSIGW